MNLDDLEKKALAATRGKWKDGSPGDADGFRHVFIETSDGLYGQTIAQWVLPQDAAHITANSPDVTLALVARIRELEAEVAQLKVDLNAARTVYVPPERFVVDAETAERIVGLIENPREPNDALRALLAKEKP